ncbi:MAG: PmoA family protein [Planctomycetota bacterium]
MRSPEVVIIVLIHVLFTFTQLRGQTETLNQPGGPNRPDVRSNLCVEQTEKTIVIRQGRRDILTYNIVSPRVPEGIDPIYARSGCLHPVQSPTGQTVTQMFPVDHPHQHGVFSAWVKTKYDGQDVDFWNLAKRTGLVMHERVISTFQESDAAGFEVDLLHRSTVGKPVDVLRERWKIKVYSTGNAYHCFDLESTQQAITDEPLVIAKYHYGGMVFRGRTSWLNAKDRYIKEHPDLAVEPSRFLNDAGSDRLKGNHEHSNWVAFTGSLANKLVSITVLSHPENFRAPQAARLHPSKPYFCFAPCVDGQFTIDREHPFKARYRYLITDDEPDAKWIETQWQEWTGK